MSNSSTKHQDSIKQEKTLAQISSAAASSARAASLSPAAIPTTLIIKPPHDHSGSNKDLLSKEAIAKFTTSNFTETIVVNSDSVFGTTSTSSSSNNNSNAAGPTSSAANQSSTSGSVSSNVAPTSVIENTGGGGGGSNKQQLNMSGGGNSSYSGSGVAKKRKADARSTPTSIASGDIDINRDLIKDVAVSLVPLPLNKNDNIDPASLSGFEKSIKKAKTEPSSPLQPATTTGDPNLQNVSPNLVQQTHGSNVISSSSVKHQSQSNSPQLQQQQQQLQQQQQQQNQPHTPSLVVSVPLSTATVPGINLPTSSSGSSGSSSTATSSSSSNTTNSNSNVPPPPPTSSQLQSGSSSSGNTPNIISPGQMPPGSSLYQQIAHRSGSDQLLNASTNRSSPVIQQPAPSAASHVIQNAAHSILERHSPSMRSSPSIITSVSSQQHQPTPPQSHNNLFLTAALDLNSGSGLSGGVSVLQSVSPVPMSAIQSTSSSPITPGGDGGLKITYEKQTPTTNARITALQEQEQHLAGRRSRTPDNSFGSNSSFSGGGGGLKFSYEAQTPTTSVLSAAVNPAQMGATSTIITTPQPMVVKESPPSSPGSDTGGATVRGSNKRNRKLSTNSNAGKAGGVGIVADAGGGGGGPPDAKDSKLFQNGVVHATHMLGNQLNPNSTVAQKMSDQLCMEVDAHSFVEAPTALVGPPFPGKSQAVRSSAPQPAPPSLSSMLSGSGTATANGNTPQSLEQLLERQWEQGSQFLMEQAQHFDIASLLSCLHQLRSENIRLEEHVNNLVARRDHLLAVNARLAIPLNPAALGGVGLGGGGGGGGGASGGTGSGSSGTVAGSGTGSAGSQGQFNNMHGNGPHEGGGSSTTTASTISSRSSRIQQHQSQQQQQTQSHFGSNSTGQIPLENGIDFRHSNTTHQNTNSSSISEKPNTIYVNF
uniref:Putative mixed-lineage leukemia protein n=1 Tax=Culex tarsalis TaxID=7177 RepID=A0A1Q3F7I4_CULTA